MILDITKLRNEYEKPIMFILDGLKSDYDESGFLRFTKNQINRTKWWFTQDTNIKAIYWDDTMIIGRLMRNFNLTSSEAFDIFQYTLIKKINILGYDYGFNYR